VGRDDDQALWLIGTLTDFFKSLLRAKGLQQA
jgi:hypothetical protein